jgi:hypothetical protein
MMCGGRVIYLFHQHDFNLNAHVTEPINDFKQSIQFITSTEKENPQKEPLEG